MSVIKAPYNFVPFNKEVVTPHWIDQISHDVPFKNGLSGKIEVKLTAMSPIFVRDGIGQKAAKDNYVDGVQQKSHTFSQAPDGRYFIPGTSLKGMIRSVLEILSFGRMEGKVNDRTIAFRDLSEPMKTIYRSHFKVDNIYGGWLKKVGEDKYQIQGYDLPGRISHEEIDNGLGTDFSNYFSDGGGFDKTKDEDKAAKAKYDRVNLDKIDTEFSFIEKKPGGTLYRIEEGGEKQGVIVFTGQPSVGNKQKRLEFIFWKTENSIDVEPEVMKGFFDAYFDYDQNQWSIDWEKRRKELDNGTPIPVFFQKERWKGRDRVQHLGLSFLYKLPGKLSIMQAINRQQDGESKLDLSEAIFGHVDGNTALKGRVQFGHAFVVGVPMEDSEKKEVLSSPKPSFFPNYIKQKNGKNGKVSAYSTLRDEEPEISGWKRYPVFEGGVKHSPKPADAKSDKILTKFTPLKAGAIFSFDIRYHNLRPVELGALLSALSFHNCSDAFHILGMAKPLGYGKVKLEIPKEIEVKTLENDILELKPVSDFMRVFEAYMNSSLRFIDPKWHLVEQIQELIAMAVDTPSIGPPYLDPDQHRDVRNNGEYLERYSDLNPNTKREIVPLTDRAQILEVATSCKQEDAWFKFQASFTKVFQEHEERLQEQLNSSFLAWKNRLIFELNQKQKAIRRAEDASSGPKWDQVDLTKKKKAFYLLKKVVEDFGKKKEGKNDIKKIVQAYPDGYLSEVEHEKLFGILKDIFDKCLNINEKKNWLDPFEKNHTMKKVAEWVGEENARTFLRTLQA